MILALFVGFALAQEVPDLDAQLYHHSLDARGTLWTDDTTRLPSGYWAARLGMGYALDPLVYELGEGEDTQVDRVLGSLLEANLLGHYTIDRFRIGLDVPLFLSTSTLDGGGGGLGDLALDTKASLLEREDHPVGLALAARFSLPTATLDAPVSSPGLGWSVQAIADKQLGPVLVAANLGTRGIPGTELENISWNDQLFYRLGGGYALSESAGLSADLAGHINYSEALRNSAGSPLEALVGGWGRVGTTGLVVRGGAGTGLTRGIGSPRLRAVISIGWEPPLITDMDLDGIADRDDACPEDKEDRDGFEDLDGCPDLDNDADGIVDKQDDCPDNPEDLDEHRDWDGCPEDPIQVALRITDPDKNPIAGASVTVTGTTGRSHKEVRHTGGATQDLGLLPGSFEVSAAAEGYEPLTASFELPDTLDDQEYTWVMEPRVLMGSVGVRVTDAAGKKLDARWSFDDQPAMDVKKGEANIQLPPGTYTLTVRADGFVPLSFPVEVVDDGEEIFDLSLTPSKVRVTRQKIDIADKVYFETAKATIKPESFELLEEVATILLDHPELKLVRIEGHTDSRGNDQYNLDLSKRRAASVRTFLIDKGVAPERLEAEGYGESKPIDDREVAEAWEANRRVEFFIAERGD